MSEQNKSEDLATIVAALARHVAKIHAHDLPAGVADAIATAVAQVIDLATDDDESNDRVVAAQIEGFRHGLLACKGLARSNAIFAALFDADCPNTKLAPGVHRAVLSKDICEVRRNLGLPVENPLKARAGRAPSANKPE